MKLLVIFFCFIHLSLTSNASPAVGTNITITTGLEAAGYMEFGFKSLEEGLISTDTYHRFTGVHIQTAVQIIEPHRMANISLYNRLGNYVSIKNSEDKFYYGTLGAKWHGRLFGNSEVFKNHLLLGLGIKKDHKKEGLSQLIAEFTYGIEYLLSTNFGIVTEYHSLVGLTSGNALSISINYNF